MRSEKRLDPLSPQQRSERMSRIRSRDTTPELVVRRLTWRMGFRYRLHVRTLPGQPDLVFASKRKVIFVHGCFWHQHKHCRHYKMPQSRLDFWLPKLEANVKRDLANQKHLRGRGWGCMVIWECQLRDEPKLCQKISRFLS
jgi:DNA mismatch endonuclease (patch repair protein)